MNKDRLKDLCKNLSIESGLSFNAIQTYYFLESILAKIAESDEKENFIFKGGFLLANVIGIRQRNTVDIDFIVKRFSLNKQNIEEKIRKILQSDQVNNISYEIQKIEKIRKEDDYGGFRVTILCQLENIKQVIPLDIATGDPITPKEIYYNYKSSFDKKTFQICAYNIETMIAEKLQTIYQRSVFNSRSKDFYDIYILLNLKKSEINNERLKEACRNTFRYRNTDFNSNKILEVLELLKNEESQKLQWKRYQKRYSYAKDITFDDTIDSAIELINGIK